MSTEPSPAIRRSGPWDESRVRRYLAEARIPMRLAANTDTGFPVVVSLWFVAEGDTLLAVTHRDSKLAERLREDPRCAFEIAPNEPPYLGVRGQARATLASEGAEALLRRLLERYFETTDSKLGRFLLGRADEERVIRLQPEWVGTWDYSDRMDDLRAAAARS